MALKVKKLKQNNPGEITIVDQKITVGQLQRGNQSITSWINAIKAAERIINPYRKQLLDTYLDISIDGHLKSVSDKRVRAVKTSPFEWVDLDNDRYKENFQAPWFHELLGHIMDKVLQGYKLVELELEDGLFCNVEEIPRQNVLPHKHVITREMYGNEDDGFRYREAPYNDFILEIGKPKDLGIYAHLAPYVLLKRGNLSDYATHNELFAMPLRVYTYDPMSSESRQQTEQAAKAQGAAAYIILPKGSEVDFKEGNKTGASQTYKELHEILNNEISITVLGQTLTTGTDGKGSYALGGIHKEVEEGVNLEDMIFTQYVLNYKFKPLAIRHGYPLEGLTGQFQELDTLDPETKAKIWGQIDKFHAPIDAEDWYNEFGVPKPKDQATVDKFMERKVNGNIQAKEDPKQETEKKGHPS